MPRSPASSFCRRLLAIAALAATSAMPFPASAQAGADCRPDGTQQQMNACAVRDFQAADAQLNIRYGHAMARLDADARVRLRREQREWLRGRDPACKASAHASEGGSAWPLVFYACLEKATEARTRALPAGDAARPTPS